MYTIFLFFKFAFEFTLIGIKVKKWFIFYYLFQNPLTMSVSYLLFAHYFSFFQSCFWISPWYQSKKMELGLYFITCFKTHWQYQLVTYCLSTISLFSNLLLNLILVSKLKMELGLYFITCFKTHWQYQLVTYCLCSWFIMIIIIIMMILLF